MKCVSFLFSGHQYRGRDRVPCVLHDHLPSRHEVRDGARYGGFCCACRCLMSGDSFEERQT